MDFTDFLDSIRRSRHYQGQIVHIHRIPRREASYGDLSEPLPPELVSALAQMGIKRLYTHQVEAVEAVRRGESVVIVTGTASGKTLCYNLPVLERQIRNSKHEARDATAFYLFPTKALAQDQLRGLRRYAEWEPALAEVMKAGCYDGDTPPTTRRKLRDEASIILTNPDMLHQGILPYHTRWSNFFTNLQYVVIDEIHSYRGIFGSNVANVIRRLNRVCEFYGARPRFICSSATIANPRELAEGLIGTPMTLVDDDGSPRGEKRFVLWNPPVIDVGGMERRSSNVEAQNLMVELMRSGVRTITFGKARVVAELMYRYVREALPRQLQDKVRPYRGGYLPEERREIERQLFEGELMGITSTNALELGIDVGGLDASIIIGFPGTIASVWQQAGRAGRGVEDSLVVFVAYNDPIDQYLVRRPEYFFGQSPESAVVDPENPYVLAHHLKCAAFELPITEEDAGAFGGGTTPIADILEEAGDFKRIGDKWYYSRTEFPAKDVNLRTISDNTFTIVERDGEVESPEGRVIGQVDSISAPELVYPQAIYMHEGETYFVEELDLVNRVASVRRANVDYYTNAILDSSIRIARTTEDGSPGAQREALGGSSVSYGPATVTWATTGFKKIKFYSLDSIGYGKVDIPPQHLETMAMWIVPPAGVIGEIKLQGRNPIEGLMGIRNLAVHALPLFAMCDKEDIGGVVDSSNTGSPTIFIYDRYTGGLGFAEIGYEKVDDLMRTCLQMVEECGCEDGCPSCVGIPTLRPAIHTDPDIFGSFPIPDKQAAAHMLGRMAGEL
ncbi:MAG: DEAD/DEAH box helicase [Armatimonadetes bacterium]|nr:DEAD/DEAH box helicase [Armatimonadota bacterium]